MDDLATLNRRLDQEYEMFSLACQDGDKADAARRLKRIEELKRQIEEAR